MADNHSSPSASASRAALIAAGAAPTDGITEHTKPLIFRGFDAGEDGLTRTEALSPQNPAPPLEPPKGGALFESAGGAVATPTAPAPKAVDPDRTAPAQGPDSQPRPTKPIIFITPIGDFEIPCYDIIMEGSCLTLLAPKFPELKADTTVPIRLKGQAVDCYYPGIIVWIPTLSCYILHLMVPPDASV